MEVVGPGMGMEEKRSNRVLMWIRAEYASAPSVFTMKALKKIQKPNVELPTASPENIKVIKPLHRWGNRKISMALVKKISGDGGILIAAWAARVAVFVYHTAVKLIIIIIFLPHFPAWLFCCICFRIHKGLLTAFVAEVCFNNHFRHKSGPEPEESHLI